jgi:hypothetical protein
MSQVLLAVGGGIFLILGSLHGLLTLRDLAKPRAFTPTDGRVREAMQDARLSLNPRANVWKAWLGFNLSHSLGLVVFGGGIVAVAVLHFELFSSSGIVQVAAVSVAAAYLALSLAFWFWGPAVGSAVSLLCFLGAIAFQ